MFISKDLSVLSYANGFTLWHYVSQDSIETIIADGYFDAAAHMLRVNDFIMVNADRGAAQIAIAGNEAGRVVTLTMCSATV